MHTAVLLQDVLEGLDPKQDQSYIDATAGEGGHLREIAKRSKRVLALEANRDQFERLGKELEERNIVLINANFADIKYQAQEQGFSQVDGVLFDLGLSFWELAHLEKGFSYKRLDDPLDMRLSDDSLPASEYLNKSTAEELYELFSQNSEEVKSKEIAEVIVKRRLEKKLETVSDLLFCIDEAVGNEGSRAYARIFQALRMQVNNEKENLRVGLAGASELLRVGGKLAVITFHSIEDRIVKTYMKTNNYELRTKKVPQFGDKKFERSATLRIGIKHI